MVGFNTIARSCARLAAMAVLAIGATQSHAQELEYRMELGGMAGLGFYLGDANTNTMYKNSSPAISLMGRYNMNPRMSLKFDLGYCQAKGDASAISNKFPNNPKQQWKFTNKIIDLGCQYEISFWGYGTGGGYKGHKRFTPYIQAGLGFSYGGKALTMNMPLGVGVKYKLKERWNVGADWTMRFAMGDKLDGIEDPYRMPGGFFKNKDSYSWTMVYISYDLMPKYRKCNND